MRHFSRIYRRYQYTFAPLARAVSTIENMIAVAFAPLALQIPIYFLGWVVITLIVNSINSVWVNVASYFVPAAIYNIVTIVLNGGVSMVVFFHPSIRSYSLKGSGRKSDEKSKKADTEEVVPAFLCTEPGKEFLCGQSRTRFAQRIGEKNTSLPIVCEWK